VNAILEHHSNVIVNWMPKRTVCAQSDNNSQNVRAFTQENNLMTWHTMLMDIQTNYWVELSIDWCYLEV
jgi:hypothetical protein